MQVLGRHIATNRPFISTSLCDLIDILAFEADISVRRVLVNKATLSLHQILHAFNLRLHLLDGLREFLRGIQVERLGQDSIVMTELLFGLFLMDGLEVVGVADGLMRGLRA